MGWRYRKSKKILPGVRLNINKNSTSVTFGPKGLHYTVSSTGRKTASVGIPGSGLSYSKTLSSGDKNGRSAGGFSVWKFLKWVLIVNIALGIFISGMRTAQARKSADIPEPPAEQEVVEIKPESKDEYVVYDIQNFDSYIAIGQDGQELGPYYYTDEILLGEVTDEQLVSLALDTFDDSGAYGLAILSNKRALYFQGDCHAAIVGDCAKDGSLIEVTKIVRINDDRAIDPLDTINIAPADIIFRLPDTAFDPEPTPEPMATPEPTPEFTPEPTTSSGIIVYITPTGRKYHLDSNCNGGSYSAASLEDAFAKGLEPCGKCIH